MSKPNLILKPRPRVSAMLLTYLPLIAALWLSDFTSSGVAQAAVRQIENVRLWHSPDNTRVVFDVSANVKHKVFELQNPLRLVVDIENINLSTDLPPLTRNNPHLSRVRFGRPVKNVLRFVFELKKPLRTNAFVLTPNELYGHRLVIDLEDEQAEKVADQVAKLLQEQPNTATPSQTDGRSDVNRTGQQSPVAQIVSQPIPRTLLIAIDAGHGGEDPGAIGYRGSHEKQITLAIAEKLKRTIDNDPRMTSFMVRKGDYFVKLHRRREIAKEANADLFISIHADAFRKRSARGFSVFTLSQSGATSAMARELAAKENASDLIGGVSLVDKDDVLKQVLVDLSMTNTISESVNFGGRVIRELSKLGKMHSRKVEQAGFAVLKSADVPSVLVETGFITNPDEESKLRTSQYQQKVATAIYTAVSGYFDQTPFRSTTTYANAPRATTTVAPKTEATPSFHKVVRGDSLSKIAERYGVRLSELKSVNNLRSNTALLGQRLKIPSNGKASTTATGTSLEREESKPPAVHTVRSGESLSILSKRYNVTIKALKRLNNLKRETVYIGMRLKIPGGVGSESVMQAKKTPRTHVVKRGDTLSEIAEHYGSSMRRIRQANSLRSGTVMLGQKLVIPN